ncbi:hypothetical protein BO226_10815 [Rhodococcus sp. 2G]|nr:hypothetical protein BO226_10815 [Rhodococcus sp. 2G]
MEPALPREVTRRIVTERAEGRTFQAIADRLMSDGIPTARGKATWYPATVKAVMVSDNAAALRSEVDLSDVRIGKSHRPDPPPTSWLRPPEPQR